MYTVCVRACVHVSLCVYVCVHVFVRMCVCMYTCVATDGIVCDFAVICAA